MNNYTYSSAGLALTKSMESCELEAYQDATGTWSVGYGHTGPDVHEGLVWTPNQAGAALQQDVQTAVKCVNTYIKVALTQGQFDALVDFCFNVGQGNFVGSTLLRKLNAGDFSGAAAQFPVWNKSKGKILPGLVRRRMLEEQMFSGLPT
jgi:lysozyme